MPVITLSTPPCKNPIKIFCQGNGQMIVGLRLPIGKSVKIIWGDGSVTSVMGTGINSQYMHTYASISPYICYICGDVGYIDIFIVTDTPHNFVKKIDITSLGNQISCVDTISFFGTNILNQIMMPNEIRCLTHFIIAPQGGSNLVLPSVDFKNVDKLFQLDIRSCHALSNITMLPHISIKGVFLLQDTSLNQYFPFHLNIIPSVEIHYRNVSIPGCLSPLNLNKIVAGIYANRNNYDNTIFKTANLDGNNPPAGGTYIPSLGYIQANLLSNGNDGNAMTAKQMKYVLEKQNNNLSITKKYKWFVGVN